MLPEVWRKDMYFALSSGIRTYQRKLVGQRNWVLPRTKHWKYIGSIRCKETVSTAVECIDL